MAVRFDAAGDALSRSTSPPNVRAFTVCGWAYALVDSGANPQPIFAMLDGTLQDGVILYWDNTFNEISITVANGGAVFDATVIATSPATGTPFFWFATCGGNGVNAVTAGIRTVSANTLTTAQADMDAAIADNTSITFADIASAQSFDGRLWNIKAWDRELSQAEILAESFYEKVQFPASLNFHWPLHRHDALVDWSGNGRTPTTGGTLTTEDGEYGLWKPDPLVLLHVPDAPAATLATAFQWDAFQHNAFQIYGGVVSVSNSYTLTADAGSYALTGVAAGLKAGRQIAGNAGSYSLTGVAAGLKYGHKIAGAAGSYSLTGVSASLVTGRRITGAAGAYSLTGAAAGLAFGRKLAGDAGSYSLTGVDASLRFGRSIAGAAGSYTISGVAAGLAFGRKLAGAAGSYILSGQDATLTYSGTAKSIACDAGAYSITGGAANLIVGRKLAGDAGSYAITGVAAGLAAGRKIAGGAGSYALTGEAAALLAARVIAAAQGGYSLTGVDAILTYTPSDKTLTAEAGSYVITGEDANLIVTRAQTQEATGGWPTWDQLPRKRKVPEQEYERLRALEEAEEERERALARARSEKARLKERERLEKARAARIAQERLIELMAAELAALMRDAEAQEMAAMLAARTAEEDEAILLMLAM